MQSQGLFSVEKAAGIFFLINEVLLQPNNPKAESHSLVTPVKICEFVGFLCSLSSQQNSCTNRVRVPHFATDTGAQTESWLATNLTVSSSPSYK